MGFLVKEKTYLHSKWYVLSSDEFRIRLKIIQNLTEKVELEIRIRCRIWGLNSNSIEYESRIWPNQPIKGRKLCIDLIIKGPKMNVFDQKIPRII